MAVVRTKSSWKHGVTDEQVEYALANRVWNGRDRGAYLTRGLDIRGRLDVQIAYSYRADGTMVVFHAMPNYRGGWPK